MPYLIAMVIVVSGFIGYAAGSIDGMNKGKKEVMKTNPPSEELEMACLGLWIGDQNKKAYDKWLKNK